ncbi:MerR family transcriptional regulator [Bacillus sp. FSL K6-0067]|uniref:MerR family transcriptional regulator n=1 Tax=Bacillus sp. FSL K6-0067 TaxID=2921412 RepID=UPI00077A7644|nr:MerR family transcriptional regulator [Bacillus cereus]KXY11474.1 hypothetical protein AT267_17755 [Bacillus cereus]
MLNKFRNLEEGITVIYCPDAKTKQIKEVYIETEDFSKVEVAVKGEWKSWKRDGRKFVAGIGADKKAIILSRIIMNISDKLQHVVNLTDNPYDLRKCNLHVISRGDRQKIDVRNRIEELKSKVPPVPGTKGEETQPSVQQLVLYDDEIKKLNRTEVAKMLGIGKSTISYWIKQYNISVKRDSKGHIIFDDNLIGEFIKIKDKDKVKTIKKLTIQKEDTKEKMNPSSSDILIMQDFKNNDYLLVETENGRTFSEIKRLNKKQIEQLQKSFLNILS